MFRKSAHLYDAVYSFKDYAAEVERLHELIQNLAPGARTMLDVACGTGKHAELLVSRYEITGVDIDAGMVAIAQERNPSLTFHVADMTDFDLGRTFDVVVNLFSSIGYALTKPRLEGALRSMARHIAPGGLLVVEPWLDPEEFIEGSLQVLTSEAPDGTQIVRMMTSAREGDRSKLTAHYLVGRGPKIEHMTEDHLLGLFSRSDYESAFETAGLKPVFQAEGLIGRGLYTALT